MTTVAIPEPGIIDLPLERWCCSSCGVRLLGVYAALGGVHVRQTLHGSNRGDCPATRHLIIDLARGRVTAHCGNCHSWEMLRYDHQAHQLHRGRALGPIPDAAGCTGRR